MKYTIEQLSTLKKSELIDLIIELQAPRVQKSHKKYVVLDVIKTMGPLSVQDIADEVTRREREDDPLANETSTKNISSLMTYLRKQDNYVIHTDNVGRKYIAE